MHSSQEECIPPAPGRNAFLPVVYIYIYILPAGSIAFLPGRMHSYRDYTSKYYRLVVMHYCRHDTILPNHMPVSTNPLLPKVHARANRNTLLVADRNRRQVPASFALPSLSQRNHPPDHAVPALPADRPRPAAARVPAACRADCARAAGRCCSLSRRSVGSSV